MNKTGFAILDRPGLRDALDERLARIGHRAEVTEWVEPWPRELLVAMIPLGRQPAPIHLRLLEGLDQSWRYGELVRNLGAQNEEILAEFDFDTSRRFDKSCYEVWIDWIVEAVSRASRS